MKNPLKFEPTLLAAAVAAVLNALVVLEILHLTEIQLGVLNIAVGAVLAAFVRQSVTPTAEIKKPLEDHLIDVDQLGK